MCCLCPQCVIFLGKEHATQAVLRLVLRLKGYLSIIVIL